MAAAIGAGLIEQQLNMAAEAFKGRSATDNLTEFLAQVTLYLSAIGFFIQVALTSRIHRYLGVGFALLVLEGVHCGREPSHDVEFPAALTE